MTKLSGQIDRSILFTKDTVKLSPVSTRAIKLHRQKTQTGKKTLVKEVKWLQIFMQIKMKGSATPSP